MWGQQACETGVSECPRFFELPSLLELQAMLSQERAEGSSKFPNEEA